MSGTACWISCNKTPGRRTLHESRGPDGHNSRGMPFADSSVQRAWWVYEARFAHDDTCCNPRRPRHRVETHLTCRHRRTRTIRCCSLRRRDPPPSEPTTIRRARRGQTAADRRPAIFALLHPRAVPRPLPPPSLESRRRPARRRSQHAARDRSSAGRCGCLPRPLWWEARSSHGLR
jgi:hypothetical protein